MAHSGSLECLNIAGKGHHLNIWKENSSYCKGTDSVLHCYCYIEWNKTHQWGYAEGSWSWLHLLRVRETCRWRQTTLSGACHQKQSDKDTPCLPVGINECLMKLQFPLNRTHHINIISAYAPTLTSPDEAKEQFYKDLCNLIKATIPVTSS